MLMGLLAQPRRLQRGVYCECAREREREVIWKVKVLQASAEIESELELFLVKSVSSFTVPRERVM